MSKHHDFLLPRAKPSTIDLFAARKTILHALKEEMPRFSGTLLDIGCGDMPYRTLLSSYPSRVERYIGLDFAETVYRKPDLIWNGEKIPLENNSIDSVVATEVLEHSSTPLQMLQEVERVLKPGGFFFFSVPFLWPLHCVPNDAYRYTPFRLQSYLEEAGFVSISCKASGGWDASLAQMIGLWARRRKMPTLFRHMVSFLSFPIILGLRAIDKVPEEFQESQMIPGLTGTAFTRS